MTQNTRIVVCSFFCTFLALQENVSAQEIDVEKVYGFSTPVLAIPIVITVAAAIFSLVYYLKTRDLRISGLSLLVSLIAGGIFAPSMYLDKIKVNSERIEQKKGFWFAQTTEEIRYKNVGYVKLRQERTDKGLLNTIWEVNYKNEQREDIDVGDLWDDNSVEIIELMKQYGVKFK